MRRLQLNRYRAVVMSAGFFVLWQAVYWGIGFVPWPGVADIALPVGWVLVYLLGLSWAVWGVEMAAQRIEDRHAERDDPRPRRSWNPLDPECRLYGRHSQRLKQSLFALAVYTLLYILFFVLMHLTFPPPIEPYELPQGGGSNEAAAQAMRVQKIIRKKYVINPYSNVLFNPPPIDQVDVKLMEETKNQYTVGQGGGFGEGEGEGGGFGGGSGKGKIRFLRLRHADRLWDRNFGYGGDRNMLAEIVARDPRFKGRVAEETESLEAPQLLSFPPKKSPPLIYVGGGNFSASATDKKALKTYMLEQHGMILGDCLSNQGFHGNFINIMNELTGVTAVPIPRDDFIHQRPYRLPLLPIVVAHGGTTPLGWKVDGRWVAYYHPGALSDAWRDDHAGIRKEIWELCYQLGVNIIFYAHGEYNKWLLSQKS